MQTFLVNYDLNKSASCLDSKRLFKQLLEGKQILDVIVNNKKAWSNHPAVRQWEKNPIALFHYIKSIWKECQKRGIAKDSQLFKQSEYLLKQYTAQDATDVILLLYTLDKVKPVWWGRDEIVSSHRSRLLCKGQIDLICNSIKKHLKVRSIDKWTKENLNKTKNQLNWGDINSLMRHITINNVPVVGDNYYNQFKWSDDPSKPYIWPV